MLAGSTAFHGLQQRHQASKRIYSPFVNPSETTAPDLATINNRPHGSRRYITTVQDKKKPTPTLLQGAMSTRDRIQGTCHQVKDHARSSKHRPPSQYVPT